MFEITIEKVRNFLRMLRGGLEDDAGTMTEPATFCLQQCVTRAMHGKNNDVMGDGPKCTGDSVNTLGIQFNDSDYWEDDHDRARGLKEFGVAELGSNEISQAGFESMVLDKFTTKYPPEGTYYFNNLVDSHCENRAQLLDLISMAVEVLQAMKSPGTKYLYLCHPRRYEHLKPAIPTAEYTPAGALMPKKSIHDVQ